MKAAKRKTERHLVDVIADLKKCIGVFAAAVSPPDEFVGMLRGRGEVLIVM